jgi:L-threonylcarbamoyladenylate synthase
MNIETRLLEPTPEGLKTAAEILRAGGLVGFPSETVYGLGGDARNGRAVARIYEAKGRPSFNPLIVHLADLEAVSRYAVLGDEARRVAEAFWPGPLTLVLPLRPDSGLSELVTAGLDTVAIRLPAHPVTRALLRAFDGPLAGPSANPSGKISPTRAEHVMAGLAGRIEAVVDGGACEVGVESTIVAFDPPTLLRPGGIPSEALEACLGAPLALGGDAEKPSAPGQLLSHYAPGAPVRLQATARQGDEVWLGFGHDCTGAELNLSESGDLVEAAAQLFHLLRAADAVAGGTRRIAVAPIPEHGLGRAINDRLRRAAAPRP